jgi:hypothetical protein
VVAAEGFEPTTKGMYAQSPITFTKLPAELYNINMGNLNLSSLLKQIAQLSPEEKSELLSLLQSGKTSILSSPAEGLTDWEAEMVARGLATGTISLYTRTVKRFLDFYPTPTARDVRNYSVQRLKEVTPTKVRNDQKALRSFFSFFSFDARDDI